MLTRNAEDFLTTLGELKQYNRKKPFPHAVVRNLFEPSFLQDLKNQFPKPDESWWSYDNALERKYAKDKIEETPWRFQQLFTFFSSHAFIYFLETTTGIEGLIADPTLRGGGLHQITRGGKLDMHVDYNVHPETGLERRLNVILYLNEGWKPEWKGQLEFWNADMTQCKAKIQPELGNLVIFSTSDTSWHGHPDPLECPEGVTRKSCAVYYYTKPRPDMGPPHSTIYKARHQDPQDEETEKLRAQRAKGRLSK